ncbi:hypothetical protein FACS1894122_07210 [Alphaproteobacteria bacterium]|nr:hypothetical protein FACS1894122_07210 [Alphaproteobacteria bacterium]
MLFLRKYLYTILAVSLCSSAIAMQVQQSLEEADNKQNVNLSSHSLTDDDAFVGVWKELAEVAISVAAFTRHASTPRSVFYSTGLLQFAARKDIAFQQRLYEALPPIAKRYELYAEDPELMARFVIPDPRIVPWNKD